MDWREHYIQQGVNYTPIPDQNFIQQGVNKVPIPDQNFIQQGVNKVPLRRPGANAEGQGGGE